MPKYSGKTISSKSWIMTHFKKDMLIHFVTCTVKKEVVRIIPRFRVWKSLWVPPQNQVSNLCYLSITHSPMFNLKHLWVPNINTNTIITRGLKRYPCLFISLFYHYYDYATVYNIFYQEHTMVALIDINLTTSYLLSWVPCNLHLKSSVISLPLPRKAIIK